MFNELQKTIVQTEITQYFHPRTITYVQSILLEFYPFVDIVVDLASLTTVIESLEPGRGIGFANSLSRVFETPRSEWRARADQQEMCTRSQDTSASRALPTNIISENSVVNRGTSGRKCS